MVRCPTRKVFNLPLDALMSCEEFFNGTRHERNGIITLVLNWWIAGCPEFRDEDKLRIGSGLSKAQWVKKRGCIVRAWGYISPKLLIDHIKRVKAKKNRQGGIEIGFKYRLENIKRKRIEKSDGLRDNTEGIGLSFTAVKDEKTYRDGQSDRNAVLTAKLKQRSMVGQRVFFTD